MDPCLEGVVDLFPEKELDLHSGEPRIYVVQCLRQLCHSAAKGITVDGEQMLRQGAREGLRRQAFMAQ